MKLFLQTLVRPYYARNAGFFGVVVYLAFGFMRPQDHHALIAAILTSPFLLLLTALLWSLYTLRATVFVRQLLNESPQRFLLSARLLPRPVRWGGWLLVAVMLLMPVEAYAGWMVALGAKHQLWLSNGAVVLIVLALVGASAAGIDHRIRYPYPTTAFHLPRPNWTIPYELFYPIFLLRHRPVAFLLTKTASLGLLVGVCRLYPTDDYDQRLLLLGLMMSLLAHAPICRTFFEFENTWLQLLPNLPFSRANRLARYALTYALLWLPELPALLYNGPQEISASYLVLLWLTGWTWLLLFHTRSYRSVWDADRWMPQLLWGFIGGLLLIMFGVPIGVWIGLGCLGTALFWFKQPHIMFIKLPTTLLVLSGLLVAFAYTPPSRQRDRPNILFIMADDLGYGDLSAYGATDLRTPYLDSLLAGGIRFTNFYANSPVCSPSRAALLSGRYPERMGVPGVIRDDTTDSWGYLAPGLLLPDYLRRRSYHTALVGKWHLGLEAPNLPNKRGFDYFYGFLGDMMDNYIDKRRHKHNFMRQNARTIDPPGHATDVFTDAAIDYINRRARSRKSFFLYLAYTAPHDPLQPPPDFLARVHRRQPGIDSTRARLVALIEHMDAGIGRVLMTLRANGLEDNTLVVFGSDNGGWRPGRANNGPYRSYKGTMYEGGIRIPAGIRWPAQIRPGQLVDTPLQLTDWCPTLLDIVGAPTPDNLDGQSFLASLTNAPTPLNSNRPLFFVRREGRDTYKGLQIHAVRQGDWKLLQPSPFAPYELYNLRNDPRETTNLAEAQPARRDQLINLLMEHIRQGGSVPWQRQ